MPVAHRDGDCRRPVRQPVLRQAHAQGTDHVGAGPTQEFVSQAKGGVMLRSSYFQRSKPNDAAPPAEAWGVGGWIWGETGELANIFSLGGAYYFVGEAYGPADGGGNFILDNDQSGYSVLGEAWGRLRFGDHALTIGRQALNYSWSLDGIYRTYNRYDGAFIGRRDVRTMVPLNFESATVAGKLAGGNVRYYGGYAWDMRQINSASFHDLAEAALLPGDSDGMIFARRAVEDQQRPDAAGRLPRGGQPVGHRLGRPRLRVAARRATSTCASTRSTSTRLPTARLFSATSAPGTGPDTSRRAR